MPENLFQHFMLLSEAIFIFNSQTIDESQIERTGNMLRQFCSTLILTAQLYDIRYCTANIHSLLHISDDVKNFGPLWTHSCFPFENINGCLLKRMHGTQNVPFQIITAVSMIQSLPSIVHTLSNGTPEHKLFLQLTKRHLKTNETKIGENVYAMGRIEVRSLNQDPQLFRAISNALGYSPDCPEIKYFTRLRKGSQTFHSLAYNRVRCRRSYTIAYSKQLHNELSFGDIEYFVQYKSFCNQSFRCFENCVCPLHNFAVVESYDKLQLRIVDSKIGGTKASLSH